MAGIINDVESVIIFRKNLQECVENLDTQLKNTQIALDVVAETWKDIIFENFNNKFSEDKERINVLSKNVCDWDLYVFDPLQKNIEIYLEQNS